MSTDHRIKYERVTSDGWVQVESPAPHLMAFQKDLSDGHLTVFVGVEPDSKNRPWWHLSISHRTNDDRPETGRIPTYEEIKDVRYRFLPDDILMVEMFPPRDRFINLHPTTRHLWEIPMEFLE